MKVFVYPLLAYFEYKPYKTSVLFLSLFVPQSLCLMHYTEQVVLI